jgi:hypothetical protein
MIILLVCFNGSNFFNCIIKMLQNFRIKSIILHFWHCLIASISTTTLLCSLICSKSVAVVCSCTCLNNCVNFFKLSLFMCAHVEMISFCTWLYVCGNAIFMNLSVCLWACYALVFVLASVGTLCSSQSLCLWEQHVLVSVCSVGMLCSCICLYVCGIAMFMELSVCLWECHVFLSLFASDGSCSSFCLWALYFHLSI